MSVRMCVCHVYIKVYTYRYPGSQIDIIAALYIIIIIIHSMVPSYSFVIILLLTVGYHLWPEVCLKGDSLGISLPQ